MRWFDPHIQKFVCFVEPEGGWNYTPFPSIDEWVYEMPEGIQGMI
jgi:hypothetical protein